MTRVAVLTVFTAVIELLGLGGYKSDCFFIWYLIYLYSCLATIITSILWGWIALSMLIGILAMNGFISLSNKTKFPDSDETGTEMETPIGTSHAPTPALSPSASFSISPVDVKLYNKEDS
jgi:hypothetical protein